MTRTPQDAPAAPRRPGSGGARDQATPLSRRSLLRGLVVTGVAGSAASVLAGCAASPTIPVPAGWRLLWSEEFEGDAGTLPDAWSPETGGGGWGNEELQTYTAHPDNVGLDGDGHLLITARRTGTGAAARWTSARITTSGRRTLTAGRLDVRAKVPAGAGIWPAIWTMGQDHDDVGWPRCGETDVLETSGRATDASQTVHAALADGTHWSKNVTTTMPALSGGFHVYSAQWTSEEVRFSLDGTTTGVIRRSDKPDGAQWPFAAQQYVLLDVAVGGTFGGPPDDSTPATNAMVVDWVRAYRKA